MLSERPKVFTTYAAYFRVSPFQRGNPSSLILKDFQEGVNTL